MWTPFLLCALVLLATVGEPFTELGFDAALERSKKEKKLLLVDFTAEWCPPCKKMEKDTWAAPEVGAWLADNAIALQIDVDEEPEFSKRFGIEAMPTVIALREGEEFDRFVGYRNAADFLEWGRGVLAGRRAGDALLERARALRDSTDVSARYALAGDLLRGGELDEALRHYLWVWPASRDEMGYGGVRVSFMLAEMAQLAKKHEPARRAFEGLLGDLQQAVEQPPAPTFQAWHEWTSFCRAFGHLDRLLTWYEAHRDENGGLLADCPDHAADVVRNDIFERLMARDRFQEAACLYGDLLERAGQLADRREEEAEEDGLGGLAGMDEEMRAEITQFRNEEFTQALVRLFVVALVLERQEEAEAVSALLLKSLDTPSARIALVQGALRMAKRPFPAAARWLDEAEAGGSSVKAQRRRLQRHEKAEDE